MTTSIVPSGVGDPSHDRVITQPPLPSLGRLRYPGLTERMLVILATFVFFHQTPNSWFVRLDQFSPGTEVSNGLAAAVQFLLIIFAFSRVVGYLDLLINIFKLEPLVFVFAGLTFTSTFWSADPGETLRRSVMFVAVALFAGYLIMRFSLDQIVKLLGLMFVASGVVNLAFLVAFPIYGVDDEGRWSGVFLQKNALGYVAALAIPTLIVAARTHRRIRFLFYAAAILQVVLLIRSDSKTMLVAGLGPTVMMAFYHSFRARRTMRGAVVLGMSGLSLFTLAFATANIGLLAGWLDKDVTLTGRVPLWESLIPVILERPWFGHGYQAVFGGPFSPAHDTFISHSWAGDAHNTVIQIWLQLGLLGVVLFYVAYFRAVSRAIKIAVIVPGTLALWPLTVLTATLLMSITESGIQNDYLGWTTYLIAVLSVAGHLRHRTALGFRNDLAEATSANKRERLLRHDSRRRR